MTYLVTGAAGFIGSFVALKLLESGQSVVGLDNLNPYYDVRLKEARLARLKQHPAFIEARQELTDEASLKELFQIHKPEVVIHLAAQAGVRYSLEAPQSYIESNLAGLITVLECCRYGGCKHLLFASSSSVYGINKKQPFSVNDPVDHPVSLYAATKRSGELIAHSYSHLFDIPTTCLRFFTVYGPWGRPDMALFLFTDAIINGRPIKVFNYGQMQRAFTYVEDVVESIYRLIGKVPGPIPANGLHPSTSPAAPFRVLNIGSEETVSVGRYIELIEKAVGKTAVKEMLPMQAGDVETTRADCKELEALIDWRPTTPVEVGVNRFVDWYKEFYRVG